MLYTDKVKEIEQKLGIDAKKLPNNLLTTHLCAICDCLSNSGGGIVDVEVLPNEYGWVGTPITKDTKRVYFNTNLSPEKIENLQNYVPTNAPTIIEDYNGNHNIGFYNNEINIDFGDYYLYENGVWDKSILTNGQYLDIDWEIHYLTEYNVKLAPLFSSTPFEKVENSIYRLPDGSLWMYHNNEWKELSFGGSGGSAGVQLKLVERLESIDVDTSLLDGNGVVNLTKELKPNTIYYIKYNTTFGYEYGTNLFTYNYSDTDIVQGYSNMMVVEGDDEERACGYFAYEHTNTVNMLTLGGQVPADSLSKILTLEIYELTSSATQTEDEVIYISGDTDYYKYDDDCTYYDLSKKGNYRLSGFTANDISTNLFKLEFGFSKTFPILGKGIVNYDSVNGGIFGNNDYYKFGMVGEGSCIVHPAYTVRKDIYIQVTDDTVYIFEERCN